MIKNKLTIRAKSFNRNVAKMRKIATLSEIDKKMKKKKTTIQIKKYCGGARPLGEKIKGKNLNCKINSRHYLFKN